MHTGGGGEVIAYNVLTVYVSGIVLWQIKKHNSWLTNLASSCSSDIFLFALMLLM